MSTSPSVCPACGAALPADGALLDCPTCGLDPAARVGLARALELLSGLPISEVHRVGSALALQGAARLGPAAGFARTASTTVDVVIAEGAGGAATADGVLDYLRDLVPTRKDVRAAVLAALLKACVDRVGAPPTSQAQAHTAAPTSIVQVVVVQAPPGPQPCGAADAPATEPDGTGAPPASDTAKCH